MKGEISSQKESVQKLGKRYTLDKAKPNRSRSPRKDAGEVGKGNSRVGLPFEVGL